MSPAPWLPQLCCRTIEERGWPTDNKVSSWTPSPHAACRRTSHDDQLIRDCQEFDTLERRGQAVHSSGGSVAEDLACTREIRRIIARQAPILQRIVAARAHTRQGLQAKAASLALWEQDMFETKTTCWNRLLVRSLVTDLLEMSPV